jgi:hypothetical protein
MKCVGSTLNLLLWNVSHERRGRGKGQSSKEEEKGEKANSERRPSGPVLSFAF